MKTEAECVVCMKMPDKDGSIQSKISWLSERFINGITTELGASICVNLLTSDETLKIDDKVWLFTLSAESFPDRKSIEEYLLKREIIESISN